MLVAISGLKHLKCFGRCQGQGHLGFLKCNFVLTRNRIGNCFLEISLGAGGTGTEGMCLSQGVWSLPDLEG